MNETNPFESPSISSPKDSRSSTLIGVFLLATFLTAVLSFANAIQEPSLGFVAIIVLSSVPTFFQLVGLSIAVMRSRSPNRYLDIFIVPAILMATLCVVSLSAWVAAGQFKEFEDASEFRKNLFQIHPITIPFALTVISFVLYSAASVVSFMLFLFRSVSASPPGSR